MQLLISTMRKEHIKPQTRFKYVRFLINVWQQISIRKKFQEKTKEKENQYASI